MVGDVRARGRWRRFGRRNSAPIAWGMTTAARGAAGEPGPGRGARAGSGTAVHAGDAWAQGVLEARVGWSSRARRR